MPVEDLAWNAFRQDFNEFCLNSLVTHLILQGRLHVPCQYQRSQKLTCGHTCESKCLISPLCEKPCQTGCNHSICKKKCGEPCIPCTEKCNWECIHMKCTKLCGDPCDRGPCNEPCQKILKCKHPCIGFCGEPCPELCRECQKEKILDLISGNTDMIDTRWYKICFNSLQKSGKILYFITAGLSSWKIAEIFSCTRIWMSGWNNQQHPQTKWKHAHAVTRSFGKVIDTEIFSKRI